MNTQTPIKKRSRLLIVSAVVISLLLAVIVTPSLLLLIEAITGTTVVYEQVERTFTGAWIILLAIAVLALPLQNKPRWLITGTLLVATGVLFIFLFDVTHKVNEEMSWIRYWTSIPLIIAGIVTLVSVRLKNKKLAKLILLGLGLLLVAAGIDEVAMFHDSSSTITRAQDILSVVGSDMLTLGAALLGFITVLFYWTYKHHRNEQISKAFHIVKWGVFAFLAAMLLDTFDLLIELIIKYFLGQLGSISGFIFSEFWIIIYDPTSLSDFIEEVLEFTAAVLFFMAALVNFSQTKWLKPICNTKYKSVWLPLTTVGILIVTILIIYPPTIQSPIKSDTWTAERLLGPEHGTEHTDDIDWHPKWGLVVANESGPNVIRVANNGEIKTLRSPHFGDLDSIAVSSETIWVSDGLQGKIYEYQGDNEWSVIFFDRSIIPEPEGIHWDDGTLYVLDESISSILAVDLHTNTATPISIPANTLQKPEDVTVTSNKKILITDDAAGVIWLLNNDKLESWASGDHIAPEAINTAPDGTIWVSDNKNRTVTQYSDTGEMLDRIHFTFPYMDIQGIAADDTGTVYVVTADGRGGGASIPSYVWKLTRTAN